MWLHNTDNSFWGPWRAPHVKVPGLPSFEGAPPGPSEAVVRPQNDFEVLFSRYKYVNLASAQQQYQCRGHASAQGHVHYTLAKLNTYPCVFRGK